MKNILVSDLGINRVICILDILIAAFLILAAVTYVRESFEPLAEHQFKFRA